MATQCSFMMHPAIYLHIYGWDHAQGPEVALVATSIQLLSLDYAIPLYMYIGI